MPRPTDFSVARRIETQYRRALQKILLRYLKLPANASLSDILTRIDQLGANKTLLEKIANLITGKMVTQVAQSNARSWREAAAQSGRGREIYEALQREMRTNTGAVVRNLVRENAQLISSIPTELRESVNLEIARLSREGLRSTEIARRLSLRVPELTKARTALIARTEVSKSATALSEARSVRLGIQYYQWKTSLDRRVRPSHRNLEDVLVAWSDPPSPEALIKEPSTLGRYHAGSCPNCRCVTLPLVSIDVINWPAKLYRDGRIIRVSRARFLEISGMKQAA